MGTNYYMITRNKKAAEKAAPYSYQLTDEPYFGYKIHIAKTSAGWLPLFQYHKNGISSIADLKTAYELGQWEIFDEYGRRYDWSEFIIKVLRHNGGIAGVVRKTKCDKRAGDIDMPDYLPVSHFEYANGRYRSDFFKDSAGYEFSKSDFC